MMKAYLIFIYILTALQPNLAFAFGMRPLHRTKRPNVQQVVIAADFNVVLFRQTITFKNLGNLKTAAIATSMTAGSFTTGVNGCAGIQLLPGNTCDIEIVYTHPGSYFQSAVLTISAPGVSINVQLNSCDPMVC